MRAAGLRNIKDLGPWRKLIPAAKMKEQIVKKGAKLKDTLRMMPRKIRKHFRDGKKLAAALKGQTVKESCRNIWTFIYQHVQYVPDQLGREQVRSLARLFHDRKGDCDCFTFTISCLLHCMGIVHWLVVAKYDPAGEFQHIYVQVPHGKERITIDPVLDRFNTEHQPIIDKIEIAMDLEFLEGIPQHSSFNHSPFSIDAMDLADDPQMMGFRDFIDNVKDKVSNVADKAKDVANKVVHTANKVNGGPTLLRLGILAAMKINMMKVAERLRWAYLTDSQAKSQGLNMREFGKLKNILAKAQSLFYKAGGELPNLKKAILTGKGNAGAGAILTNSLRGVLPSLSESDSLRRLLGDQLYNEVTRHTPALAGVGLGEPGTAAAIAAATTAITGLAVALRDIKGLLPQKASGNQPQSATGKQVNFTPQFTRNFERTMDQSSPMFTEDQDAFSTPSVRVENSEEGTAEDAPEDDDKKGFTWANPWVKAGVFTVGGIGVAFGGYKLYQHMQKNKQQAVNGPPKKRGRPKGSTNKRPKAKKYDLI